MHRLLPAFCLFLTSPVALACSVAPGYRVPTTLELVDEADAIVLARVDGGVPAVRDADATTLALAPLLVLKEAKGTPSASQAPIAMPGWLETREARATRSPRGELAQANPDAFTGACNRYLFARGTTLLLFLKRDGKGYRAISHPFARTAEDVRAFDARWVKAVREYIAIAAFAPELRRARMEARRDLLRRRGDADSRAIAADIDRELNGPRKALREALPPAPDPD